jgi:hypothetical protein
MPLSLHKETEMGTDINMLHLDFTKVKNNNSFLELRFKDVFSLPKDKYRILEKLADKYPAYNFDSPERVSLANPDKKIHIHVHLNRLIIEWENPPNLSDFLKVVKPTIDDIVRILKIQHFSRTGIRVYFNYYTNSPEEAFSYISNRYYSSSAKKYESIADEIFAPKIQFSGRKGSLKFNLTISYEQQHTIQGSVGQQLNESVRHSILFDIDAFKDTNLNANNLKQYFTDVEELINNRLFEYIKTVER